MFMVIEGPEQQVMKMQMKATRIQKCEVDTKQMYQLERVLFLCLLQVSLGPLGMKGKLTLPEDTLSST